jgi:hypothetical protein
MLWLLGRNQRRTTSFERILATACKPIGAVLLSAPDPDAFECALLGLLEDERAANGYFLMLQAMDTLDVDSKSAGTQLRPEVQTYLGETAEATLRAEMPVLDALAELVQKLQLMRGVDPAARPTATTLGELLAQDDKPPVVYGLFSQAVLGTLALMGLVSAMLNRTRTPEWLSALGAACFVTGSRATLRLLGSLPAADISETLLPMEARLDFEQIGREFEEGKLGLGMLRLEHQASGQTCSFPFGGPVDDA